MDLQPEPPASYDAAHPSRQGWFARLKKALGPVAVVGVVIAKFFAKLKFFILPALKFLPILLGIWLIAWLTIPASSVFHYGVHVLLVGCIVAAAILFLKPKDYDSHDVEVSGLYWHFVDLVWMFIFPLVYLMSTRV